MDDLMSMVGQILSDPEQMKQLSSLAASLGLPQGGFSNDKTPDKDTSSTPSDTFSPTPPMSSATPNSSIASLLPLLQKLQSGSSDNDQYIIFLRALQPLLSHSRQQRVENAIMILRLLAFLPALEESGLLPKNPLFDALGGFLKGGNH